jgi:predicted ATPase
MEELKRKLQTTRLLTLTGAGGCGKTRLALEVGPDLLAMFADGVWWVELAPLTDPTALPQAVATALSVQEQPGWLLVDTLTDYLRTKHLLLILDNCEHLVEACALLVESLLKAGPHLKILATSRETLGLLASEAVFDVPPLSTPDRGFTPPADVDLIPR